MVKPMNNLQKGSLNVTLAIALGVVLVIAAVAAKYYLDVVREGYKSAPTFSHDELFRPMADLDIANARSLDVLFKCSALAESAGYERQLNLTVGEHLIAYERGEMDAFFEQTEGGTTIPAKLPLKFEIWRGTVVEGQVVLEGWYTEGPTNTVKRVEIDGTFKDGKLDLHGKRGPRYCSVKTFDAR